jgi:hypothetical protein
VKRPVAIVLLVAATATACGGNAPGDGTTAAPAERAASPALAHAPKKRGEVLVQAQASPRSHGPFTLDGRYVVRFEQIAPEDPKLDFATQTAFVATLDRKSQQEGGDTVRLFRSAARTGRRTVTVHGRWYLDVSFGDFPYAIRLTPVGRR